MGKSTLNRELLSCTYDGVKTKIHHHFVNDLYQLFMVHLGMVYSVYSCFTKMYTQYIHDIDMSYVFYIVRSGYECDSEYLFEDTLT